MLITYLVFLFGWWFFAVNVDILKIGSVDLPVADIYRKGNWSFNWTRSQFTYKDYKDYLEGLHVLHFFQSKLIFPGVYKMLV